MSQNMDELLPSAKDVMKEAALRESERAQAQARRAKAAADEKKALIDQLSKPSGLTEDAKVKLAADTIKRAVANGLVEVQVYRFPNSLCTDKGRAINQQESGWEKTLTGVPRELYQLWFDHLRPKGYRIKYQIIDFPEGVPGDIGVTIAWG